METLFSSFTSFALNYGSMHSKYASIDSFPGRNLSIRPKEVKVLQNSCPDLGCLGNTTNTFFYIKFMLMLLTLSVAG